ncbi:MAG: excinuclease ABC subunit A [Anaerolineae bacterium CG2_30_64_16]|nr:MAG: excinuclease ABC subunit A [Anaerolineae bacterium CG2_30_64_16]
MAQDKLTIRGAREHNLKNIDLEIPRDQLVVITGLSGSGKSSLAFDTIYAEGQRRYVESLSAYARQFLGLMEKPDVDQIEGLSPAISIDQRGASRNPRSTVGTITEIYDYLRLLFARIGIPHCPQCGREISAQTVQQIVDSILEYGEGSRLLILAPLVMDRKGEHKGIFDDIRKAGFVRVRVDGELCEVETAPELDRYKNHTIEAVVDRLVVRRQEAGIRRQESGDRGQDSGDGANGLRGRLADSVETALRLGGGVMLVSDVTEAEKARDRLFSERFACPACGVSLPEIEPRTFSFNSPHGACPACTGLGSQMEFDPDLIIPDKTRSLAGGAIKPWSRETQNYYHSLLEATAAHYRIPFDVPVGELSKHQINIILYGGKQGDNISVRYVNVEGQERRFQTNYEGVITNLQRRYRETSSDYIRSELERYMTSRPCPACGGKRLRPEALAVTVLDRNIDQVSHFSVTEAVRWVETLAGMEQQGLGIGYSDAADQHPIPNTQYLIPDTRSPTSRVGSAEQVPPGSPLTQRQYTIARQILKELHARIRFLMDVGLDYLSLDRMAATLSGGEAQRIRLATQIGSQLMGVLYILDEPSIGLHQRDNARLIRTLLDLRDLGNTVLVIEHDEETMRASDWIVDLGPGAGEAGGYVVCSAPAAEFMRCSDGLTAAYLRGEKEIPVPKWRRPGNGEYLIVRNASENNLKHVDVRFPLGKFICITGVSGSGKSSLVLEVLYKALAARMYRAKDRPGQHDGIDGMEQLDKVIDIDQSPIGRTPRSNPATYTNVFTVIRDLFASLPESKMRGYKPGRFSFNVKGGRCEACRGDGIIRIEMQFLPDVYVPCEVCHGKRYNREALEIKYKGKSIAEVLDMTVSEALHFFQNIPPIRNKLETLAEVGLGYIRLGQPATTLSGGEAQRVKLSKELSRRATGRTLYILDEPTTGLHFDDIQKLLVVLHRLADQSNTVVVIEHNLDVIKSADWVIDLGPEGGDAGGYVIAEGTPEHVASVEKSYTGQYLRRVLAGREALQPAEVITARATES